MEGKWGKEECKVEAEEAGVYKSLLINDLCGIYDARTSDGRRNFSMLCSWREIPLTTNTARPHAESSCRKLSHELKKDKNVCVFVLKNIIILLFSYFVLRIENYGIGGS